MHLLDRLDPRSDNTHRLYDTRPPNLSSMGSIIYNTVILGQGTKIIDGRDWIPYQAATFPTPPFPEFISGHSTFSAAAAEILRLFTRKDDFGASVSFAPGTSKYEPGFSPADNVTLTWRTFSQAADEAGFSRRIGGIHFEAGDL